MSNIVDKKNKNLVVKCEGGICNRLNNIINGFYYYKKYNFEKMYFLWTQQHGLNCKFSECFQIQDTFEVIDGTDPNYEEIKSATAGFRVVNLRYNSSQAAKMKNHESFIIASPKICPSIPIDRALKIIKHQMLIPAPDLCSRIEDFLIKNDLKNNKYIGVHIRRTDQPLQKPLSFYTAQIRDVLKRRKAHKFFVCSDDSRVEREIYSKFPSNVIIRPKKYQPISLTESPSSGKVPYTDTIGEKLKSLGLLTPIHQRHLYNIYRSPEATVEGVIDLFLLGHASSVMGYHKSTFCCMARLMGKARRQ